RLRLRALLLARRGAVLPGARLRGAAFLLQLLLGPLACLLAAGLLADPFEVPGRLLAGARVGAVEVAGHPLHVLGPGVLRPGGLPVAGGLAGAPLLGRPLARALVSLARRRARAGLALLALLAPAGGRLPGAAVLGPARVGSGLAGVAPLGRRLLPGASGL